MILVCLVALSLINLVSANSCNVLVLSGGGSYGAFQAGVLTYLKNSSWDLITGVSAGSLNAGFISLFSNKDQLKALETLEDTWLNVINTSRIYKWNSIINPNDYSLLDNSPLRELVDETIVKHGGKAQREILIGVTNLEDGKRTVFNTSDLNAGFSNYSNSLMASTAIPVLFPPEDYLSTLFIDGGMVSNELILPSISKCHQMGKTDISFDIVICSKLIEYQSYENLLKLRIVGLMERDIEVAENTFFNHQIFSTCSNGSKRFPIKLYSPNVIFNWTMIDFSHKYIAEMFELGQKTNIPKKFTYCY